MDEFVLFVSHRSRKGGRREEDYSLHSDRRGGWIPAMWPAGLGSDPRKANST